MYYLLFFWYFNFTFVHYFRNTGKSATVLCVQYLLSQHMKGKHLIKRDELMKTVFKGRITGKNYDRVVEDVSNTLTNVINLFKLYF